MFILLCILPIVIGIMVLPVVIAKKRKINFSLGVLFILSLISLYLCYIALAEGGKGIQLSLWLYLLTLGLSSFLPAHKQKDQIKNPDKNNVKYHNPENLNIPLNLPNNSFQNWFKSDKHMRYTKVVGLGICMVLFFPFINYNMADLKNTMEYDPIGLSSVALCISFFLFPIGAILLYYILKLFTLKDLVNSFSISSFLLNIFSFICIAISIDISIYFYVDIFHELIVLNKIFLIPYTFIICLQLFFAFVKFSLIGCMLLFLSIPLIMIFL